MTISKAETFFDWMANLLGLAGGIPAIAEKMGKIWGNMPEPMKQQLQQKMPGFLGLSLADEQIFDALTGKLSTSAQKLLSDFLYGKCKDFQRNRFINIVAGMEVVAGTPTIIERQLDKSGKISKETTTASTATEDLRLNFLKKFIQYIQKHGVDEAHNFCIGGRIIMEDPFYQKALTAWQESIDWFEKTISSFFGVSSLKQLKNKMKREIGKAAASIEAETASMPKHNGHLRGIFGEKIGEFLERIFC